jgi:hypothetical protein
VTDSLIRRLATHRAYATDQPDTRYDETRAITFVREGKDWVPSYASRLLAETKKADIETGEDQKGT